jgi:hypothetical protein
MLGGWDADPNHRTGNWRFVAFASSSGESGDSMLHKFRVANRLAGKQYNALFIHKSELLSANLGPDDTVVFVDDFSGTGEQVTTAWTDNIAELLTGGSRAYLLLAAASVGARTHIQDSTGLTVVPGFELNATDNIFSVECTHFTQPEKDIILQYCRRSNRRHPKGRGDSGFLVVLAHSCPNNTIPILHSYNRRWEGLFRRYD